MLFYLQQGEICSPVFSISRQPRQLSPVHSFISVTGIAITTLSCSVRFIGFTGLQSVCMKFVQVNARNHFLRGNVSTISNLFLKKQYRIKEREETSKIRKIRLNLS